jgi:ABC-type glycerol-3-phosphate transport system permease component
MAVNITATAAAVIVSMAPMIALYAVAQRYMQRMALLGA